ncbi:DNA mismatch repair protein MSH1 mitochondrial [Spathaspora sp. JA1]|nr:DNA mismatch repair protein MSH1 mitochondrial [Spathaspora sp. JA1]
MRSWTTEEEIALFNLVCDHKPAGVEKDKHMDVIISKINNDIPDGNFSVGEVWDKLATLYDLKRIDYLEDWEGDSGTESIESRSVKKEEQEDVKEEDVEEDVKKETKEEEEEEEEDEEIASPVPEPIKKTRTGRARSREPKPRRHLRNMAEKSGDESSGLSDVDSEKDEEEEEEALQKQQDESDEEKKSDEEEDVKEESEKPKEEEKPRRGRRGLSATTVSTSPVASGVNIEQPIATSPPPSDTLPDWDRGGRKQDKSLTALYATIRRLIDKNPESVCLIQVGSFYEIYFEQAEQYASKLGLKLAIKRTKNFAIPMSGFPISQLRKYVEVLVHELGVNVAVIEQSAAPSDKVQLNNLKHRKISRIVSPGTLIDESFLNFSSNNYLLAISFPPRLTDLPPDPETVVGLSWVDISVGESFIQQTTLKDLSADISRISPSEILLSQECQPLQLHNGKWYSPLQILRKYFLRYHTTQHTDLKLQFKAGLHATRKALENLTVREHAALSMVLSYVRINLPESNFSLELPTQYYNANVLQMDPRTRDALELIERSVNGRASVIGSFLTTIRGTATASGTRLLTQWIKSPILDINELQRRQSYVKLFLDYPMLRMATRLQLGQIGDFVRFVQRLIVGTGDDVVQLVSIADSLGKLQKLEEYLQEEYDRKPEMKVLGEFLKEFNVPRGVADEIHKTIYLKPNVVESGESSESSEEAPVKAEEDAEELLDSGSISNSDLDRYRIKQPDGLSTEPDFSFSVNRNFNETLSNLHDELDGLEIQEQSQITAIQQTLSEIDPKLTVSKREQYGRYSDVLYISGKQKSIVLALEKFDHDVRERKQRSFIYKPREWDELQRKINNIHNAIVSEERRIIEYLKIKVLDEVPVIRHASRLVDFLDVTSSFAILAQENHWTCPELTNSPCLEIEQGRHVVVESSLREGGSNFTPNNTNLGSDGKLWVISGPNMGGKSTFLRQNALIVILAQIGSYVPCERAKVGIVDKLFTRIGASDDLFNDLSTFMVEMVETSNILRNASTNSLAIVDEIGRGTSGKEGLAIAYATLRNLVEVNQCRTLFATHFGRELEQMLKVNEINQSDIRYFRTRVLVNDSDNEFEKKWIIDHHLEPGISATSNAIEVAQMAGFPERALDVARGVLLHL